MLLFEELNQRTIQCLYGTHLDPTEGSNVLFIMLVSISKSTHCHDREALNQYRCALSCVMWCNSSVRGISLVQFFLFMQHLL
jgi:hypothetical protein